MTKVALVGAGKIGEAIVNLLAGTGDYEVVILDQSRERLAAFAQDGFKTYVLEGTSHPPVPAVMPECEVVINAAPFYVAPVMALAACRAGVHYLDLTEDVESTRAVMELAKDAKTALIPQCGLAPGFISIAATHLAEGFEELRDVQMRVGALPI